MVDNSVIIGSVSILIGLAVSAAMRPSRGSAIAAAAGGIAVSLFDILGIYTAHRFDWW